MESLFMNNLKYKNSFNDEFNNDKFKYVITNPPYGGDKNVKSQTQNKRDLIKEFIKNELKDESKITIRQQQLKKIEALEKKEKIELERKKVCLRSSSIRINKFAKKYELIGNDKESISLMLMMDLLDINGTCIGVLKEGVFFNRAYSDLRKTKLTLYL
jgi:hypothetical protein